MSTGSFSLNQIGQISVTIHDVEQAVSFYRDVLGMPFLFASDAMAFFDCGGVRLMLAVPESEDLDHPGSIIYYRVANIAQAYEVLVGRGVEFEVEPHLVAKMGEVDLWLAFFRDLDQNLLALLSEVPSSN